MGEFEGYGGSAEIFVGVGAVGLGGVDYGDGVGDAEGYVGEVVVGDDEVEAEGFGLVGGGEGADAGVDADDEADAGGCGVGEDSGLHAVAFADAVGDVVGDAGGSVFGGYALDGGLEEDGGGGAVDVVVAVDEDGLGGGYGLLDAGDGGAHAEHEERVVEVFEGGVEEALRVGDAAGDEEGCDWEWAGEFFGEALCGDCIDCGEDPVGVDSWPFCGLARRVWLVFGVVVVDDDAAEVGDGFDEGLETVVPFGGGLEDEHDALMGEA